MNFPSNFGNYSLLDRTKMHINNVFILLNVNLPVADSTSVM